MTLPSIIKCNVPAIAQLLTILALLTPLKTCIAPHDKDRYCDRPSFIAISLLRSPTRNSFKTLNPK